MRYKGMQNARVDNHRLDRGRPDMVGRDNVQLGSGSRLGRVINCAHRYRTTVAVKHAFVGCVADCIAERARAEFVSMVSHARTCDPQRSAPISCVIQTLVPIRSSVSRHGEPDSHPSPRPPIGCCETTPPSSPTWPRRVPRRGFCWIGLTRQTVAPGSGDDRASSLWTSGG